MASGSMIYTDAWGAIRPGKHPDPWPDPTAEGILAFHFYKQGLARSYVPQLPLACKLFMHEGAADWSSESYVAGWIQQVPDASVVEADGAAV